MLDLQAVAGDANFHVDAATAIGIVDNAITVHGGSGNSVFWDFASPSLTATGNTFTGDAGGSVIALHLENIQGNVENNTFNGMDMGVMVAGWAGPITINNNTFENSARPGIDRQRLVRRRCLSVS